MRQRQAARKIPASTLDPTIFRSIMSSFPTGVTVITSRCADGKPVGLTANAVTSVSLDPPLLLICLGRERFSTEVIVERGVFAVNFLAEHQEELAQRFARSADDKFQELAIEEGKLGVPLLPESLARAECSLTKIIEAGDHLVLIGRIVEGDARDGQPLMFFRRQFGAWPVATHERRGSP